MEICMKIPGHFLKSALIIFILSFFALIISGWQFAPETESAEQNVSDEEKLKNYDYSHRSKRGRAGNNPKI
jgi:hypothetical protein